MKRAALAGIIAAALYAGGFYHGLTCDRKAGPIITGKGETRTKALISPDIWTRPKAEQFETFRECAFSRIEIDGAFSDPGVFRVSASTKCQAAERDFLIECGSAGGWKFYAGAALGAAATAGMMYGAVKIFQSLK